MWTFILETVVPLVLRIFGITSSQTDLQNAHDEGVESGKAQQQAATDSQIMTDVSSANQARDQVKLNSQKDPTALRTDDGFRRD